VVRREISTRNMLFGLIVSSYISETVWFLKLVFFCGVQDYNLSRKEHSGDLQSNGLKPILYLQEQSARVWWHTVSCHTTSCTLHHTNLQWHWHIY